MKLTKKKVFVSALVISLVAIISMGTLAWFTDSDDVTNKFNFATSGTPSATDFGVDVYEIDKDGTVYDSGVDEDGITYNNILPGDELVKKAFVKNTSTDNLSTAGTNYSQFVRATVKIKEGGVIKSTSTMSDLDTVNAILDFNSAKWSIANCTYDAANGEYVVVLYGNEILEPNDEFALFTTVTVPTWLTVDHANTMGNAFSISIKAEAVQSDNTGYTTAQDAFANIVD